MLFKICCFVVVSFSFSCKATTYYIVRHAEKEAAVNMMSSDVPLSAAGKVRAAALRDLLLPKNIEHIFSTNYQRTRGTAMPLSDTLHLMIELYDPKDLGFIEKLRNSKNGNLVVGHSNTVDDLVNGLLGRQGLAGDLPENQYGDLFIIKRKGKRFSFEKGHYGAF